MSKALEIKMSSMMAAAIVLCDTDLQRIEVELREITGNSCEFFDQEFAVLDLEDLSEKAAQIRWPQLIALFHRYGLRPVAVCNAVKEQHEEIVRHGLSIEKSYSMAMRVPRVNSAEHIENLPAMVIDTPVRGGQRIYAHNRDLIVTAVVNCGAEVIADGSIHIYAPLRGRCLAGASGNTEVRIFALSLEAELVSIAGVYRTFENAISRDIVGRPVQIRLLDDALDIETIRI